MPISVPGGSLPIVNDLTSGGASSALSAAQGPALATLISARAPAGPVGALLITSRNSVAADEGTPIVSNNASSLAITIIAGHRLSMNMMLLPLGAGNLSYVAGSGVTINSTLFGLVATAGRPLGLLCIGQDNYITVAASSSLAYKYTGTFSAAPYSGNAVGDQAYMSDWNEVFVWNGSIWEPMSGEIVLSNLLSDSTFTESGSGLAEQLVSGAAALLPKGLVQPGGEIVIRWNAIAPLNANGKSVRWKFGTANDINGQTFGGNNVTQTSAPTGTSGYCNLRVKSNTAALADSNALDSYGQSTLTDVTGLNFSTTDYWVKGTIQLSASAGSLTYKFAKIVYRKGG